MALYPEEIRLLLNSCEAYIQKDIDIETIKSRIWNASRVIVSLDERELFKLLIRSEAQLDSMQYTTDDDKLFERTLEVIRPLMVALQENLGASPF